MCLKPTLIPIQSLHFSDNTVIHSVFLDVISSYPHNNPVTLTGQVVHQSKSRQVRENRRKFNVKIHLGEKLLTTERYKRKTLKVS